MRTTDSILSDMLFSSKPLVDISFVDEAAATNQSEKYNETVCPIRNDVFLFFSSFSKKVFIFAHQTLENKNSKYYITALQIHFARCLPFFELYC